MNLRLRHGRTVPTAPATTPVTSSRPASDGSRPAVVPLVRREPRFREPTLTTPFEEWCEAHDVHPEALGAWEAFVFDRAKGA